MNYSEICHNVLAEIFIKRQISVYSRIYYSSAIPRLGNVVTFN